ncbi:MAG: DUF1684 domain-containing protein [Ignavibacteria bacterium]|nr:DUF1684 domain-containing protein [Ignavibacteria bacterium]
MKITISSTLLSLFFIIGFVGCNSPVEKGSPEYLAEANQWHNKRIESLKKDSGWLNLVGLFILKEGENTFGSGNANDFNLDLDIPNKLGTFTLKDSIVTFESDTGVKISSDGKEIRTAILQNDMTGKLTILEYESLRFFILKRGKKYALRVRDLNAPLVKEFKGIDRFPVNEDWKISAKFVPYSTPKLLKISNIIGSIDIEESPGMVSFNYDDKTHTIDAIDAGDKLFLLFADETNGTETYGAGRFLYCSKPDSNGNVIIDFNKAYNPPCVFTPYATCPLPPPQNHLKLEVTAGEKTYGEH